MRVVSNAGTYRPRATPGRSPERGMNEGASVTESKPTRCPPGGPGEPAVLETSARADPTGAGRGRPGRSGEARSGAARRLSLEAFDSFGRRPHPCRCSGGACAGYEHQSPRSPRRAATRSPRPQHSPGDHSSQGPSPHVPAGRPGKVLTGHDVQTLPRAATRRAPLSRRASRGCAAPAAPTRRRSAPLLRHERLPDDSRPRPPHGHRGLSDLRLRAPGRLTPGLPARRQDTTTCRRHCGPPGAVGLAAFRARAVDGIRGRTVDNPAEDSESRG